MNTNKPSSAPCVLRRLYKTKKNTVIAWLFQHIDTIELEQTRDAVLYEMQKATLTVQVRD